jgi:hypothetical protein
LGNGRSPRGFAVQQHHEIRLAFGQPEAGNQPRRLLTLLRAPDRLLVRPCVGRKLELSEPFAESS